MKLDFVRTVTDNSFALKRSFLQRNAPSLMLVVAPVFTLIGSQEKDSKEKGMRVPRVSDEGRVGVLSRMVNPLSGLGVKAPACDLSTLRG